MKEAFEISSIHSFFNSSRPPESFKLEDFQVNNFVPWRPIKDPPGAKPI
tara:strand:+ start:771 stop:917 length:147 start_codon:yes stop_codon:yes gene_type:complete